MDQKLLEKLNLKDCVVTADALNTQIDTTKKKNRLCIASERKSKINI